ncbi:MAG: hypothetical protein IT257_09590 [Chitinophagaceae bacterium]|nr:hypothetical protein [Chitinophagaceae bacterium]
MKQYIKCLLIPLCLCVVTISFADKIEKKGTILNSNCNPIGTKCKASNQLEITATYVYNEPNPGSFSLRISDQIVNSNGVLQSVFKNKTQFVLEEAMQVPEDVVRALKMPTAYTVAKGTYRITYQQNYYTILFKD